MILDLSHQDIRVLTGFYALDHPSLLDSGDDKHFCIENEVLRDQVVSPTALVVLARHSYHADEMFRGLRVIRDVNQGVPQESALPSTPIEILTKPSLDLELYPISYHDLRKRVYGDIVDREVREWVGDYLTPIPLDNTRDTLTGYHVTSTVRELGMATNYRIWIREAGPLKICKVLSDNHCSLTFTFSLNSTLGGPKVRPEFKQQTTWDRLLRE